MSLFIAQITGSVIVTDSETRWMEFEAAQHREQGLAIHPWSSIYGALDSILLDYDAINLWKKSSKREHTNIRAFMKAADGLVLNEDASADQINRLVKFSTEIAANLNNIPSEDVAPFCVLSPSGGFYDTNVQRLLLKSSCEHYLDKVRSVYRVGF